MAKKENKDINVWFGDTEKDTILRKRITDRCVYMTESVFLKEAAEEKLNREDLVNSVINQSLILAFDKNSQQHQQNTNKENDDAIQDFDVEGFLDSIN